MKLFNATRLTTLLFMVLLLTGAKLFSQDLKPIGAGEHRAGDAIVSPIMTAPCMGTRNEPSEDLNWQPLIITKNVEHENPSPDEELLEKIKTEKQKLKDNYEQERMNQPEQDLSTNSVAPVVGKNYSGNQNNGGSPMDNCIAVSDAGIVVSVANTTIRVYDANGNLKYNKFVLSAISDSAITDVCDEYVIYDRGADRFIAFAEECSANYSTSQLLMLFSKTNNPATGGWWYYKLSGNPFTSQFDWFDYPKMAVTDNDLYISGNLFNGTSFDEAAVWQIRKSDAYAGNATLTYQVWHGIAGGPFTICPVGEGQGGSYGPGCYLVATTSSGSSGIKFYQITNDVGGTPAPQLKYNSILTAAYSPPADASQKSTTVKLKINDCRVMNGFYLNGIVHFVFNTDWNGGYSGIYYGRINAAAKTITSKLFGGIGFDIGYPSVSSFTTSSTDKSVMIGYGRTGPSIFPEMRVVNCDDGMNWSASVLVKSSDSCVIDGSALSITRWGDYTGTARRHNSGAASIWMSGMVGSIYNYWNSWIAEIHEVTVGINEVGNAPLVNSKIYPNPVSNFFQLEFNLSQASDVQIDIYNMEGKLVKDLFKGKAYQGDNEFSFNKSNLSWGVYFLTIRSDSNILKSEKIVVTD